MRRPPACRAIATEAILFNHFASQVDTSTPAFTTAHNYDTSLAIECTDQGGFTDITTVASSMDPIAGYWVNLLNSYIQNHNCP